MKRTMRFTATAVALLLVGAACAAPAPTQASPTPAAVTKPTLEAGTYQAAIQARGKIQIGTREDNVPFGRKDPATNRYEGFDVEIAREIGKSVFGKVQNIDEFIEWVPVVSATRIPTINENKVDFVIATFTINEERRQQIDFSTVYFRTGQKVLVKKSDTTTKTIADLKGKTVCTARGSTSEKNIATANKDAKILPLDTYAPCLLALQQGQADAISTDETILFGLVKQDPNTKIVGPYFSDEPYGIGIKKDRKGFDGFINARLAEMISDGRWATFYKAHITPVSGDEKKAPHDK